MFYDESSTRSFDDNNDFCMTEECDGANIMDSQNDRVSPPPYYFSGLPSSPADNTESCIVIVEEQRQHIHSVTCSPSSSCSSTSTSPPVVRAFSSPPKRINWRDHMRDLHKATIDESIHRLTSMRGGIEKKKRGKGGMTGGGVRRPHRPGCAMHVWSLVKHIKESTTSDCSCHQEIGGLSNEFVDRLRRLTRFDPRITAVAKPHRFTYSYKLEYSLPSISEEGEEEVSNASSSVSAEDLSARLIGLTKPQMGRISRSVSPPPSRPHCSSPVAPEGDNEDALRQMQQPVVLSEEEMCARLSALPIGYHTTASVAALETALYASLTLMDTEPDE